MLRTLQIMALLLATATATLLACSSGSSGGSSGGCDNGGANGGTCCASGDSTCGTPTPAYTSCANLTTPTVSFAKDIQPIFNQSCAIAGSTCHGDPNLQKMESTTGQVWLGLPVDAGAPDSAAIIMGLVGVKSPENPQMDLVAAGDPKNSYLMHKLDYDECLYASICNKELTVNPLFKACGLGMPNSSGILELTTRDTIRRWIAQGAKNN
jgi:hypothetical protein